MYQLRPLTAADLGPITKIETASRPTPWSEKLFADELTNDNSRPMVVRQLGEADNNNPIVGYVIPWHIADEIQIQNIVVAPAERKKGLGALLLNTALTRGLKEGCIAANLEVRESNTAAVALYQKYQFTIVGRRERYYRDGETALLMNLGPFENDLGRTRYAAFIQQQTNQLKKRIEFKVIA